MSGAAYSAAGVPEAVVDFSVAATLIAETAGRVRIPLNELSSEPTNRLLACPEVNGYDGEPWSAISVRAPPDSGSFGVQAEETVIVCGDGRWPR